ncbi:amino acid adenylation domain-containing protein [Streptomyces sp. NBC_00059]|uniref:non-ribosomal peptide synthetase n=1 Tax=Streptomyces sp. NBC_00059 TaxID=2975635 RepID=UPI002256C551|nr:amino acid adenylation domain-containing protein [Streptomyces sp. NBC_00059]MCX5417298.1 amino acid adenylation domain-containing protein [Streptomyces sp. NBC_00059]
MTFQVSAEPASLSQQRIWFTEQLLPGTSRNNLCAQFVVHGELDVPTLERAVNDVIARHESLRTGFRILDEALVQEVLDEARITVRTLDAADEESALATAAELAREPFDLSSAPLVRAGLVQGSGGTRIVVFALHLVVADAWSLDIFLREVMELCRKKRADGVPDPLDPPATRYVDFATSQREWVKTPPAIERRAAQVRELSGFPAVVGLPADRPRPAVQTFAVASSHWRTSSSLASRLEEVAREHGETLRTVVLASFSAVLSLWSRQSRLLLATPAANRSSAEAEGLIGPFENTLVIPADLEGDPSFAAHLERVGEVYRRVASENVPFEEVIDAIAPERSLSYNPLVQVMAAFEEAPAPPAERHGAGLELISHRTATSQFDLVLDVIRLDGGLDCRLQYAADLFDQGTAERFLRHLRRLWEVVAARPDAGVGSVDLADLEERAALAALGTGPTRPVDPRALPVRLSDAARSRPDAVAVKAPDGTYTYAQLIERAEAIAAALTARGLRPGDLVGVALPRGRDLPAGLLGVWAAGGAYVPLDPAYPGARLEHMTHDAGITVLLSTRDLADHIPVPAGTEVLVLDEPAVPLPAEKPAPASGGGDDVAYVIYTSGSTGRPKGVMVSHQSLGNLLDDFMSESGFGTSDRLLALTSLSFDIAGLELWLPLLAGGTLVIGPPGVGGDPERLHRLLSDETITVVQATPATWKLYASYHRVAPPALRQIWSGGEHLPHSLAQALTAMGPEVHNLYGPTETTIWSTRAVLRQRDSVTGIGRPLSNTRLYVVHADGLQAPMGVPGELCIGGAGLALGYLGRPDLTAQRFVDVEGLPVYRTGDLVRWRSDGNLEYLGRLDDQVKIRGHRVEPGEVDAVARACPGVQDACTLAVTTSAGEEQMVTFVTPGKSADQADDTTGDWRAIWENAYAEGAPAEEDDLNLKGWRSSYSKQPLPEAEMRDWVTQTVDRIAATGARTFAEIGCGTGLLLLRLAPSADRYLGIDFSAEATGHVERAVARRGLTGQVRLATAAALEIGDVAGGELFDCVVINSVAQYFPGPEYLTDVLTEASRIVAPGGHIFVGDLRSLKLAAAFHSGVLEMDDRLGAEELRALAARHALEDDELLIDPGYFAELQDALPAVTGIQASLKAPGYDNEMTRFRYDVLLKIGGEEPDRPQPCEYLGWEEVSGREGLEGLDGLDGLLGASSSAAVVVDGIPNARVARFAQLATGDEMPRLVCSPEELDEVAARHGWDTRHAWSSHLPHQGRMRTVFTHRSRWSGHFVHERPAVDGPTSNDPGQGARLQVLKHSARAFLRQSLPEYMVPNRVLTLPELPLTPNGKTDRIALRAIARQQVSSTDHVLPSGPVQNLLHEIWCEVLNVSRVSVVENIFDAGTTSLLVVRIRQELCDRHGIDVPLTSFFTYPTISSLAQTLDPETERHSSDGRPASPRAHNATAARRRQRRRQ